MPLIRRVAAPRHLRRTGLGLCAAVLALVLGAGPATAQSGGPSWFVLEKSGDLELGADGMATPGDLITYTLTVRNTNDGQATIDNIVVTDPELQGIDCGSGSNTIAALAIGSSVDCTGTYAITQADIDAGFKDNTATATGDIGNQSGQSVMDSARVDIPVAMPTTGTWGLLSLSLALGLAGVLALRRRVA